MPRFEVVETISVRAPVRVVWQVVNDPALARDLDPRVTVVEAHGEPGAVGSSFSMEREGGPGRVTATVLESDRPWRCVIGYGGLSSSIRQTGELREDRDQTVLRWTISGKAWRLRDDIEPTTRVELVRWLAAVARLAESLA